jgi:hypothetical protein
MKKWAISAISSTFLVAVGTNYHNLQNSTNIIEEQPSHKGSSGGALDVLVLLI